MDGWQFEQQTLNAMSMTNRIYGQVRDVREFKWGSFVVIDPHRWPTSQLQCVLKGVEHDKLNVGAWVVFTGELVKLTTPVKRANTNPLVEMHVNIVEVLSQPQVVPPITINEHEPTFSLNTAFDHRGLSLSTEFYRNVFRTQGEVELYFRKFLEKSGFLSIHTPKIVAEGAEGGTNKFELDYFGKPAYLSQSPQLYKQIACAAFGRVYEVAPVFRAEEHATSRHLNEYISLDVEMILDPLIGHSPLQQLIMLEYDLLSSVPSIRSSGIGPIIQMTVGEIKVILGTAGHDLSGEEEVAICQWAKEKYGSDVVFATHYHRDVRPFYTKLSEDGVHTESFDCIFRGVEITSGGQRSNSYDDYIASMEQKGLNPDKFSFYLENFKYGFPIHGGFAIGLERLTAKLCDLPSTKMASLFPRDVERLTP